MNSKLICILLSVVLAGSTLASAAALTAPAASEPLLADGEGVLAPVVESLPETQDANTVTNLNTGEVFLTITAALADIDTQSGHTLSVSAGTFPERPIVSKGVTLVGAGSGLTTVNGFAIQMTQGVSISGFRMAPATHGSFALNIYKCPGVDIHDNVIENVAYGINSFMSPGSIVGNTITSTGYPCQYAAVEITYLTADDTLIFCDNVITSQQFGVKITSPGSDSLIDGNDVTITPLPGYYQYGMQVTVYDSIVRNNRVDLSFSIGGSSSLIYGNEASGFGVGGTGQQVYDNTMGSLGLSGSGHTVTRQASISSISLNYLIDTTITDNDLIYMYMGPYFSGLTISDNVFYSPSARSYAINFFTWDTNPVNCVIERNTVVSGYSTGFYIGGGRETVRNLVIRDNVIHASTGICLDDCSDSCVQWNRFETCSEALYIRDASCNNEVSNNTFLNNYFAMSLITNSINNRIFHNNIISTYNQQISTCYPNTWYSEELPTPGRIRAG